METRPGDTILIFFFSQTSIGGDFLLETTDTTRPMSTGWLVYRIFVLFVCAFGKRRINPKRNIIPANGFRMKNPSRGNRNLSSTVRFRSAQINNTSAGRTCNDDNNNNTTYNDVVYIIMLRAAHKNNGVARRIVVSAVDLLLFDRSLLSTIYHFTSWAPFSCASAIIIYYCGYRHGNRAKCRTFVIAWYTARPRLEPKGLGFRLA